MLYRACNTRATFFSFSEAFHLHLHRRASVIPKRLKHLRTPVVLIRLNRILREHKGNAFVCTVHRMLYEHLESHRQFTRGLVSSRKSPFQQSWSTALGVGHASSHALEDCRAAEYLRRQEANVVHHIMSLSFIQFMSVLHIHTLKGWALAVLNMFANESCQTSALFVSPVNLWIDSCTVASVCFASVLLHYKLLKK